MGKKIIPKIIAFLCALIIWIIVYNIYDPIITRPIKDAEVLTINESSITSIGKVYTIDGNSKINFYIKGKQSVINSIKKTDIKATADLSRLSDVNAVKINISIPAYSNENIEIIYGDIDTIKISLDNYVTKSFQLSINPKNELNDNYYLKSNNLSKMYIKISGPQQKINKISEVYIEPNLEYVSPNNTFEMDIKAVDSFKSNINLEELTLSTNTITYKPTVYNVREIPINLNLDVKVPFGYEFIGSKYSPKKIKVTGEDSLLMKFNEFDITYSISELKENKTISLNLKDYLLDGLFLITDDANVNVNLIVEKLEAKKFVLEKSDIILKNMPESMVINYLNNPNLYIEVMGNKEVINKLETKDILAYVDFSNLNLGKHSIKINSLNEDLILISSSSLKLELKNEITIIDAPIIIDEEVHVDKTETNKTEYIEIKKDQSETQENLSEDETEVLNDESQ